MLDRQSKHYQNVGELPTKYHILTTPEFHISLLRLDSASATKNYDCFEHPPTEGREIGEVFSKLATANLYKRMVIDSLLS